MEATEAVDLEFNPHEATKHMEVRQRAWQEDLLPEDSDYRASGHILVSRDAADSERMEEVPYAETQWRGLAKPASAERVWRKHTEESLHQVGVARIVEVGSTGFERIAVLRPNGEGARVYMDADKLRLACYWTRADTMLAREQEKGVTLYRDGDPVAVVMPLRSLIAADWIRRTDEAADAALSEKPTADTEPTP